MIEPVQKRLQLFKCDKCSSLLFIAEVERGKGMCLYCGGEKISKYESARIDLPHVTEDSYSYISRKKKISPALAGKSVRARRATSISCSKSLLEKNWEQIEKADPRFRGLRLKFNDYY